MVAFVQSLLASQVELGPGLAGIAAHGIVIVSAILLGGVATIATRRLLIRVATVLAGRTASACSKSSGSRLHC